MKRSTEIKLWATLVCSSITAAPPPRLADSRVPGDIDICALGVSANGVDIDSKAIEYALLDHPHAAFYFRPGTYLLDNSQKPGMLGTGFSGSLRFAPGAVLTCTDVSRHSADCVKFNTGSGLIIDGMRISYSQPTPQMRGFAAGFALELTHLIGPKLSNIQVDGSAGVGVYDVENINSTFTNITIQNTSADGFSSVNSRNTHLTNLKTDVTMDDALSVINYAKQPDNRGFTASKIDVSRSASRGIAVIGRSDVNITDFLVRQTCSQGILVYTDRTYLTRTSDNVKLSQGVISGVGRYTNDHYPCANPAQSGIGAQYLGVGSVTFESLKIFDTAFLGLAGNSSADGPSATFADISNIEISGPNVGGVTIYNTKKLHLSKIVVENASGGFFLSDNGIIEASSLTATNVAGFLHRAFDFEKNDTVSGSDFTLNDNRAVPSGNEFFDSNNAHSSYSGVAAAIAHGRLKVQKGASASLSLASGASKSAPQPDVRY